MREPSGASASYDYLRHLFDPLAQFRCVGNNVVFCRGAALSFIQSSPSLTFRPMRLRVAAPLRGASKNVKEIPVPSPVRNKGRAELLLPFISSFPCWSSADR